MVGTYILIGQLGIVPGPQFKYFAWPVYLRVILVSNAIWVGAGAFFIQKQSRFWLALLIGLFSPVVGILMVNPFFIFVLAQAYLTFALVGVATGALVCLIARSAYGRLNEVA